MLEDKSGKPFKCDQCNYTSNRQFDLRRHKLRHARVKPIEGYIFKCSECQFATKWKRNMRRHMQTHEKTVAAHKVEEEEEETEAEAEAEAEQTIEEYFVEVINGSETEPEVDLVVEEAQQPAVSVVLPTDQFEKNKRFKCDLCRYTSKRLFDIRRHKRTHTRVKVIDGKGFKCDECNFITKWKRNMGRHMKKHEKAPSEAAVEEEHSAEQSTVEYTLELMKPNTDIYTIYASEEQSLEGLISPGVDIKAAYTTETQILDIQVPAENHSDPEKRFMCPKCEYTTKRIFDLRRHLQVHAKTKHIEGIAYQCNTCSFISKWKRNMRRHVEKHRRSLVPKEAPPDKQQFNEVVVDQTSDLDSQVEDTIEGDPEVLPSYWIALTP
ncbi:transcriptional repressor CTCFL [Drosophila grimshawi]|uniref:GH20348 n=1 Tax=Drosophila grimshawi TaxID=7222 RepID=B4J4E8_DROGR|nr:transcriptional repressor CTCFL [Drosophila grimshawi]EDW01630.1 GH20348 [Drosophila grimshawi]